MRQNGFKKRPGDRGRHGKSLQAIVTCLEAFETSCDRPAQEEEIHPILGGNP